MSASQTLHKFILYAPDSTTSGTLERRLAVRPAHLTMPGSFMLKTFSAGGALLTPDSISSATAQKTMTGSVIIYNGESLEAVRKIVESDIYYTSGVWDKERLVILPWLVADLS